MISMIDRYDEIFGEQSENQAAYDLLVSQGESSVEDDDDESDGDLLEEMK